MPTEKMKRRLDRLRGNQLPPDQIPGTIRKLTTLIASGLKSDAEAAQVARRWEPALGPDSALEFRDTLIWARKRIAERGGLCPALYGADILWSETWAGVPSSETLM